LITSCSDVIDLLKSSKSDRTIRLVLIVIGVEIECRSIARSLSGWGSKGESDAPIAVESEIAYLLKRLKLIRRLNSSMIAIEVESEYRSVAISLFRWGHKGEPNAPITAETEKLL
jgi:hypothetical protein